MYVYIYILSYVVYACFAPLKKDEMSSHLAYTLKLVPHSDGSFVAQINLTWDKSENVPYYFMLRSQSPQSSEVYDRQ